MINCSCVINGHCLCYQMGAGVRCECAFDCECEECDGMQTFLILVEDDNDLEESMEVIV